MIVVNSPGKGIRKIKTSRETAMASLRKTIVHLTAINRVRCLLQVSA
jgi:hypothetical protein